jgi:hypothetical protein
MLGIVNAAILGALGGALASLAQVQPLPFDAGQWTVVRQTPIQLPVRVGLATVLLLQSREATHLGGAGQSMFDVDLLMVDAANKLLYSYVNAEPPESRITDLSWMPTCGYSM